MIKMFSVVSLTTLLLTLTGCSGSSPLNDLSLSRLTSLINPVSQQQTQNSAEPNQRNYVGQFYGPIIPSRFRRLLWPVACTSSCNSVDQ